MTAMDDSEVLTASIGEYTLDTLGRDNLTGLQVTFDPSDQTAFVKIALADPSDESQRRVVREMFDVESVFKDEAVITFVFVDNIHAHEMAHQRSTSFSYA